MGFPHLKHSDSHPSALSGNYVQALSHNTGKPGGSILLRIKEEVNPVVMWLLEK